MTESESHSIEMLPAVLCKDIEESAKHPLGFTTEDPATDKKFEMLGEFNLRSGVDISSSFEYPYEGNEGFPSEYAIRRTSILPSTITRDEILQLRDRIEKGVGLWGMFGQPDITPPELYDEFVERVMKPGEWELIS